MHRQATAFAKDSTHLTGGQAIHGLRRPKTTLISIIQDKGGVIKLELTKLMRS